MAAPTFTMRQLLEAGVHFGHTTRRWNPKMKPFIFGERNGIHIIDLEQTVPMLGRALEAVRQVAAGGGRVLFVGTKRQAQSIIKETAVKSGQYYVNHRWLGGMLTNWKTVAHSIKRLKTLEEQFSNEQQMEGLTKRERLGLDREKDKLELTLGGIKDMGNLPDVIVIVDTNKESIAVQEANKLGIPVVGIIDSNSDPDGIAFPVPGNDDAMRAISLYCDLLAGAVLSGLQESLGQAGVDVGASEDVPVEPSAAEEAAMSEETAETPAEEAAPAEEAEKPAEEAAPAEEAEKPAEEGDDKKAEGDKEAASA